MNIPKSISSSPIIEAVAEIRFDNELPSAVLFGKLYTALSADFSETEQLPILEMPSELSERQPELKYAPHYRLKNDKFIVNIGKRSVSVNRVCLTNKYDGWDEYFPVIDKVFKQVERAGFIDKVERVTVRYINFFEDDIKTVLNLNIDLFGGPISSYKDLRLAFPKSLGENGTLQVGVTSDAKLEGEGIGRKGLILDLVAFKNTDSSVSDVVKNIKELHEEAKVGFFESLDKEYLESLEPVYE